MAQQIYIQPAREGKGRSFKATVLSYVTADALWEGGTTGTESIRPVWMMLAGTENELRPFVANLQLGKKAESSKASSWSRNRPTRFEILKSAGYKVAWQRTPIGSAVTIYLPDLFRLDPGMVDPKGVGFSILPARSWLIGTEPDTKTREYAALLFGDHGSDPEDLERTLRLSPLFIAYLDRRTNCPLVPDPRFWVQILHAALTQGFVSWGVEVDQYRYGTKWGYSSHLKLGEYNTAEVGLANGLICQSSHENLETFLAQQVKIYFERVGQ